MRKLTKKQFNHFSSTIHKQGERGAIFQKGNDWCLIMQTRGIYHSPQTAYLVIYGKTSDLDNLAGSLVRHYTTTEDAYNYLVTIEGKGYKLMGTSNSIPHLRSLVKLPVSSNLKPVTRRMTEIHADISQLKKPCSVAVVMVELSYGKYKAGLVEHFLKVLWPEGVHLRPHTRTGKKLWFRLETLGIVEAEKMVYVIEHEINNYHNQSGDYAVKKIEVTNC